MKSPTPTIDIEPQRAWPGWSAPRVFGQTGNRHYGVGRLPVFLCVFKANTDDRRKKQAECDQLIPRYVHRPHPLSAEAGKRLL